MAASPVGVIYDKVEDRESAYEVLTKKAKEKADAEAAKQAEEEAARSAPVRPTYEDPNYRSGPPRYREDRVPPARRSNRQSVTETAVKAAARSVASQLGRALVRGILGGLSRGR
jgi:hypothetical protein